MKRLDVLLIVAALILAFVTIAAVVVRAGGHEISLGGPGRAPVVAPAPASAAGRTAP